MLTVTPLLEAYPSLQSFVSPFPPERQDGAEFCDWGGASRRPFCTELARWLVESDQFCERHAAAVARCYLLWSPPHELARHGAPTRKWRAALSPEEASLVPGHTVDLLDTLAELVPLAPDRGAVTEAALGAWIEDAMRAGLLTRPERSAIIEALAEAICAEADRATAARAA